MHASDIYGSPDWDLSDGIMRPGGLELTRWLLAQAALPSGAKILDLGCGRGFSTAFLAASGYRALGVDSSEPLLREAAARFPHCAFRRADAGQLTAEEAFDAVLLECVLSAADTDGVLSSCGRAVSDAGLLLVSDVYAPERESGALSRAWWQDRFEDAGFSPLFFRDRTEDLKEFAARLLWEKGSLKPFCGCMRYEMPASPGYFALIARKRTEK